MRQETYEIGSRMGKPRIKVCCIASIEEAKLAIEMGASAIGLVSAMPSGPGVIEVDTCRFFGHHSGDAQLYRGKDEVKLLREQRDCIANFRRQVTEAALLEANALDAVDREVADLIDRAVATAREAPVPDEVALLTDVYVSY